MDNIDKLLELRVETSQLLGRDEELVLHGGGNTSLKVDGILYVKGSGWDLSSIQKEGFSPARNSQLLKLLEYETLGDSDMVKYQREALIDDKAPNPSVEAILHALIPYRFVDHTHADSIVTLSNSINGKAIIEEIFGDSYLIIPYVMPGFILAKVVEEMSRGVDWATLDGIILHNHGVFTFDDDAKKSYDNMIATVAKASRYLDRYKYKLKSNIETTDRAYDIDTLRELLTKSKGYDVTLRLNTSPLAKYFASQGDSSLYKKGVLTPEHIIRTKRFPAVIDESYEGLEEFKREYIAYFDRYNNSHIMLNPTPNWIVLRGYGVISVGKNEKEANIIDDIVVHTMRAILYGESLGGYVSINESDSFNMEYWELEQNKLN
jgi:rhamnose utilization protein RhaD (predicted bifunctional aldolase and dehydrogenase)